MLFANLIFLAGLIHLAIILNYQEKLLDIFIISDLCLIYQLYIVFSVYFYTFFRAKFSKQVCQELQFL